MNPLVNEEKVKLMTKLASYEKTQGKKDFTIMRRMKADYISHNGFITCFFVTIALIIVFGANFLLQFINEMSEFTTFDYVGEGVGYLTIWIFFMVIYTFISGRLYRSEYEGAETRINKYKKQLKELGKFTRTK